MVTALGEHPAAALHDGLRAPAQLAALQAMGLHASLDGECVQLSRGLLGRAVAQSHAGAASRVMHALEAMHDDEPTVWVLLGDARALLSGCEDDTRRELTDALRAHLRAGAPWIPRERVTEPGGETRDVALVSLDPTRRSLGLAQTRGYGAVTRRDGTVRVIVNGRDADDAAFAAMTGTTVAAILRASRESPYYGDAASGGDFTYLCSREPTPFEDGRVGVNVHPYAVRPPA